VGKGIYKSIDISSSIYISPKLLTWTVPCLFCFSRSQGTPYACLWNWRELCRWFVVVRLDCCLIFWSTTSYYYRDQYDKMADQNQSNSQLAYSISIWERGTAFSSEDWKLPLLLTSSIASKSFSIEIEHLSSLERSSVSTTTPSYFMFFLYTFLLRLSG